MSRWKMDSLQEPYLDNAAVAAVVAAVGTDVVVVVLLEPVFAIAVAVWVVLAASGA